MSDPFETAMLDESDADYMLPITEEELDTLKMALSLMEERSYLEGDEANRRKSNVLYNRAKRGGLLDA